jgi:hypothetical protein
MANCANCKFTDNDNTCYHLRHPLIETKPGDHECPNYETEEEPSETEW